MSREYDLVVWGASGFTGALVAEYIARKYGAAIRWAIGGRARDKLERVQHDLAHRSGMRLDVPIVLGDSADRASLDAIARRTRVVCTTVGPYGRFGRDLVAACVAAGTALCDLSGEVPFIRDMIDAHHARARETGARIVHACGYDSVPSDLGTLMLQEHARDHHRSRCIEVKHFAGESRGGVSGGTLASVMTLFEDARRDARVRRLLGDPYALDPERSEPGPDRRDMAGVRWDEDTQRWTGPFPMAPVNACVVRRTNALLGYAWGRDFRYREAMTFGRGARGWLSAVGVTAGLGAFAGAMAVGPVRRLLARTVLPRPGSGPSEAVRDSGFFVSRFVGTLDPALSGDAPKIRATVRGTSDPGYGETAKMLAESALCLVRGEVTAREGGVLTPGACFGMRLVERLRAAGMTFDVECPTAPSRTT